MDDDIQLPPLPPLCEPTHTGGQMLDYARAAVLADRERRAKQGAKPVVHRARVILDSAGYAWSHGGAAECPPPGSNIITLRWTDDGRVWIESERNRELARRLRVVAEVGYTAPTDEAMRDAADALDGGER